MSAKFWAFAEACDELNSVRGVKDLLGGAVREHGFETFALITHAQTPVARSLGVLVHNWPSPAIDHLFEQHADEILNPVFAAVEASNEPVYWASLRKALEGEQRRWLIRLVDLAGGEGVSQAMKSTLVNASCSFTSQAGFRADHVALCMRMANYVFHHIQHLQRPDLQESQRLTAREHECLYRAAVCGERPKVVARKLGVKISTVRTLRQKANLRLDANSAEQAVWRMLETGQLFRRGRKTKPRTW